MAVPDTCELIRVHEDQVDPADDYQQALDILIPCI